MFRFLRQPPTGMTPKVRRMNALITVIVGIGILVCGTLILPAAESTEPIPVGVAQVDVTPDYPVRLHGFGGRRAESEGVTQKIWAKALAFADEQRGPAIVIAADNLCVSDEITKEI